MEGDIVYQQESFYYNLTEDILLVMEERGLTKDGLSAQSDISIRRFNNCIHGDSKFSLQEISNMLYVLEMKVKLVDV